MIAENHKDLTPKFLLLDLKSFNQNTQDKLQGKVFRQTQTC